MDETTTSLMAGRIGEGKTSAAAQLRAVGILGPLLERLDDPTQLRLRYGVPVWWTHHYGDCDFDELFAHSHDRRRVLAAASAMIRDNGVNYHEVRACRFPDLPPCGGGLDAPYVWQLDRVPAGIPGAVPFTRVVLS